ncbi:MAG: SDR family NAD(P)-dependent oxidoreductase [Thermoanaerobaculia bacterium]|nr:SDR family NAD(P)-dependent oxidoreductase [Thermoanaerobaculia bacterium]
MKKNIIRLQDVPLENQDLTGKTVVFTGGTDGMGRVAVEKLAKMGAGLVVLGRSESKSKAVVDAINQATEPGRAQYVHCDLASQASVRRCADEVLQRCPEIHVLVNCAGANFAERRMTEDGMEVAWAVNHLGGFLLTHLLLDRLKESAPSRIVHLSSATEKYGHIHLDDLSLERNWATLRSYAQAKLALNMCTRKMARELEGTGVTVNALNPGWIKTEVAYGRDIKGWRKIIGGILTTIFGHPREVGADRIVTMSIAPQYEGVSGEFIYEDYVKQPNPEALDDELVEKVWNLSMSQVGLI